MGLGLPHHPAAGRGRPPDGGRPGAEPRQRDHRPGRPPRRHPLGAAGGRPGAGQQLRGRAQRGALTLGLAVVGGGAVAAAAGSPERADVATGVQSQLQKSFAGAEAIAGQYPQYAGQITAAAKSSFLDGADWAYGAGIVAILLGAAPWNPAQRPALERPVRRRLPVRAGVRAAGGGLRLPGTNDGVHQRAGCRRLPGRASRRVVHGAVLDPPRAHPAWDSVASLPSIGAGSYRAAALPAASCSTAGTPGSAWSSSSSSPQSIRATSVRSRTWGPRLLEK